MNYKSSSPSCNPAGFCITDLHCCVGPKTKISPCQKPVPKPKEPIDLSKLVITMNPITGDILDYSIRKMIGKNFHSCVKIIQEVENDLEIDSKGKLTGSCKDNSECNECVKAINSSVLDSKSQEVHSLSIYTGDTDII